MEITAKDLRQLIEVNSSILLEGKDVDKSQDYESTQNKILTDLRVNFGFVVTFGTAITTFYPIVESFIRSSGTEVEMDIKSTVVYLTICALAIAFKEPKESYKQIFEELRLRGTYKFLKPIVAVINIIKNIFSFFASKTGEVITGIADMFAYTALFVPFAIVFQDLIAINDITLDGFISGLSNNPWGTAMSLGVSLGTISAKHFMINCVKQMKEFNSLTFQNIKKVIDKLKNFSFSQIFDGTEPKVSTSDIKKFSDFQGDEIINDDHNVSENKYVELDGEWGSLGEYVEKIEKAVGEDPDKKTEYIRVIGKYLDSKPDIRVANAVDLLPEYDQRLLVKELEETFLVKESLAQEFIEDIKDYSLAGKGGFNSFLKVITALNLPEIKPDVDNCPKNFSIIYSMESLNKERLVEVLKRFRSLSAGIRIIENITDNVIGIYFGLKFEGNRFFIEYGILADDKRYIIGEFKFGSLQYRKMMDNKSKSLKSFQEEMKDVDLKELKLLMKVKDDFTNFSPGYFDRKSNAIIKDNVLIQGFYGVGNWNSGILDKDSYENIKQEFKDWVLTQKWKEKVLVNIKPGKFWVYFKIKLT